MHLGARIGKTTCIEREKGNSGIADQDSIQRVIDGVLEGIQSNDLAPGQRLRESEFALRWDVGRASLREGLTKLSADGVVVLTRHRGTYIAALNRKIAADLLEVFEVFCSLSAGFAAVRSSADGGAALQAVALKVEMLVRASENNVGLTTRREFYRSLLALSGNDEVVRAAPLGRIDLFRAQFERYRTYQMMQRHAAGYLRIADAIVRRDPRKAELAVRHHFEETRMMLSELPEDAFAAEGSFSSLVGSHIRHTVRR